MDANPPRLRVLGGEEKNVKRHLSGKKSIVKRKGGRGVAGDFHRAKKIVVCSPIEKGGESHLINKGKRRLL